MQAIAALFTVLIILFLASSGAAGYITYAMVQDVNRKRGKEQKPREWNRDLIGIITDYRAARPHGKLTLPLVVAVLFMLLTGAGLFAAFSQTGSITK